MAKPSPERQPAFGRRLRTLRTQQGLSQRALAGDLVAPSYISLLESGRREPTLDVLLQLSQVLGVPPEELAGGPLPLTGVMPAQGGPIDDAAAGAGGAGLALVRETSDEIVRLLLHEGGESREPGSVRAEARALGERLRERPPSWATLVIGLRISQELAALGDDEAGLEILTQLAQRVDGVDPPTARIKILVDLAAAARDAGDLTRARVSLAACADLLPQSGLEDTPEHVRLLGVCLSVRCELGADAGELASEIAELIATAERVGQRGALGRAHWAAGTVHARLGRTDEAVRHLTLARSILGSLDLRLSDWTHFCTALASLLVDLEVELDTAGECLDASLAVAVVRRTPPGRLNVIRAKYLLLTGDPAGAEALCRATAADGTPLEQPDQARLEATWGRALLALDCRAEAQERLRAAALRFEEAGHLRQSLACWRLLDQSTSRTA
ncbi:transcriptional regulator with XRE-family HTH domain [Streptacidiphilus sp. MAP12-33]|uniref:helix-turn-helix domain-containing protein n=1 Tax=Streptacidiphilus sp. MAP12-33 TaxID=3156266 RepID=UPI0035186476